MDEGNMDKDKGKVERTWIQYIRCGVHEVSMPGIYKLKYLSCKMLKRDHCQRHPAGRMNQITASVILNGPQVNLQSCRFSSDLLLKGVPGKQTNKCPPSPKNYPVHQIMNDFAKNVFLWFPKLQWSTGLNRSRLNHSNLIPICLKGSNLKHPKWKVTKCTKSHKSGPLDLGMLRRMVSNMDWGLLKRRIG